MCRGKMKLFLLLLIGMFSIHDAYLLSKKYTTEPDGAVNDLSEGLTAFSPLSNEIIEHPTAPGKQKANHKYLEVVGQRTYAVSFDNDLDPYLNKNNLKLRNSVASTPGAPLVKLLYDPKRRQWTRFVFIKRLQKRDALDMLDTAGNGITGIDRQKAKALGQLLLNNNKNYENTQDNYIDDDDVGYSKNENRDKMNWENYQNQDGASVMELIALNARHKKYMQQNDGNYYYYKQDYGIRLN